MSNQLAIITGASKGLGFEIANALAKAGFNLIISSTKQNEIEDAAKKINLNTPEIKIQTIVADLSTKEGQLIFANSLSKNPIHVLVNNAGRYLPGQVHNEPEGTLEAMINTNLYSAYAVTRAVLPLMLPQKKGYIFNICSIAGQQAYANGGSYSISKYALIGFSKNLRLEMMPHNIAVTTINPGATWSNAWAGVDLPIDRIMEATDIAKMLVACTTLSPQAVVEDITLRPILGDL
jgi:short-subunit dehydrogenase